MCHKRLCLAVFIVLAARGSLGSEPFFQDGRTDWKIYLSPQADPTETFAAEELRDALKKISGADFEVLSSDTCPTAGHRIGDQDHHRRPQEPGGASGRAAVP